MKKPSIFGGEGDIIVSFLKNMQTLSTKYVNQFQSFHNVKGIDTL
jgi:hypothetical protein